MPGDNEAAPAYYPLSQDNHSGLVVIAAVIFLIYAVAGIVTKSIIRYRPRSINYHDVAQAAACLLYFVQTVVVVFACNHGLGQHQDALSPSSIDTASKYLYVSYMLAILVDGLAKLSICLLIRHLYNDGKVRWANHFLGAAISLWMLVGILATAFQCSLPTPWFVERGHRCSGAGPIFIFNGVMRVLTDVCLCIIPVAMVWRIKTPASTRQIVIVLFGTRLIAPITLIPALAQAKFLFEHDSDVTWSAVPTMIWYQISLGLSVLTACIPSMKSVIDSYLGSTSVATIRSPYGISSKSKSSWLQAVNNSGNKDSSKNSSSKSKKSKLKGTAHTLSNHSAGEGSRKSVNRYGLQADAAGNADQNESALELTQGVVVVRDFQMTFDERRESHSTRGSGPSINNPYYSFP